MDTGESVPVADILNAEGLGNGEQPPALPQSLSPGGNGAPQQQGFFGGKYKTIQEYDKGHKAATAALTQEQQKRAALEKLLGRDDLKKLAASDPQIKDALTKAGYTLAEAEEKAEEAQAQAKGDVWNGDENDPRYQVAMLREEMRLEKQTAQLERELKRPLKPEEWTQIKEVMRTVSPKMHVLQAWRLTDSFLAVTKESHEKELAKLRGAGQKPGSRPPPNLLPQGQKGADGTAKRPSQKSAAEKRADLLDTVRGAM